ncbi:flavin reductase family protein [Arthrobacter sp. CAU 1506]|uniref:flavin reductase family protein n=1 Tax=Arthrobacter sp. CAU 1506 TaxID=2560052 RepID=UPI0010ABC395|nr:flavin reductase family protein [Arthrobacter sp. CAU 1506]TJY66184.1 flavin reductase family protein [Arthrobacter sp. CAU 1506]
MTINSDVPHENLVDQDAFRAAMADLPAAVSIVTTVAWDGTPHGATVSAVSSLSMTPPLVLVCLDAASDTLSALSLGRSFLIHITAEGQQETALAFAKKGPQKFDDTDWTFSESGQPLLAGAAIVLDCVVSDLLPGGDHTIVVGRICGIEHAEDRRPIVYHRRQMLASPAV